MIASLLPPNRGNLSVESKSPLYRIPLKITAYLCVKCQKFHKSPSRPFTDHYDQNAKHYGWPPLT